MEKKGERTLDQDTLNRRINDFARRAFRDMADQDYIASRLACRAELMPQFLWSAQQAFEKYLKYILLVNRLSAKVGHDIVKAFDRAKNLPFKIELSNESLEFIKHVAVYGGNRYLDVSYFVDGLALLELDRAVWELRRYCQVFSVHWKKLSEDQQRAFDEALSRVTANDEAPRHEFRIEGGYLEGVLENKKHPARDALIWQNAFFGVKARRTVKIKRLFYAANAPLYLFPDMLDELAQYVQIPGPLKEGYEHHLETILADPSKRP